MSTIICIMSSYVVEYTMLARIKFHLGRFSSRWPWSGEGLTHIEIDIELRRVELGVPIIFVFISRSDIAFILFRGLSSSFILAIAVEWTLLFGY